MSVSAREIEADVLRKLGPNYDKTKKPFVYFFDKAVEDHELTAESGRPRFKNVVYISKRSATSVTRQEHHRLMEEQDKQEWPKEWEYYLRVHENRKKARISQLPGIDEATKAEMRALEIHTLEQLIEQAHFAPWKALARRILDATENRTERRQDLPRDTQGQAVGVLAGNIGRSNPGGTAGAGESGNRPGGDPGQARQKKGRVIVSDWSFEVTL